MRMRRLFLVLLLCVPVLSQAPPPQPQWGMQYFYDRPKEFLAVEDMQFPSTKRGIAVGAIREGTKEKAAMVQTSDGGATWTQSPLEELPVSLFFLNDSLGWMVTEKGLWKTTEGGRDWRK